MLDRFVLLENAIKATTALSDERIESLTAEEWKICRKQEFGDNERRELRVGEPNININ